MHVAAVQLFELPDGMAPGVFLEGLKEFLMHRIDAVPYLTSKLLATPFGLDHPVWVRDDAFQIDNHVRLLTLAQPASQSDLEAAVADLHAVVLPRDKPLWDLTLIAGLADNKVAYYYRTHHACLDGMAAQTAIMRLMDEDPQKPQQFSARPEEPPVSASDLLFDAWQSIGRSFVAQAEQSMRAFDSGVRLARNLASPERALTDLWATAPATRFNRSVGSERTYAMGDFDLPRVRSLAKNCRATVNEVFLALCGGGLRRYLKRQHDLPEKTLHSGCPVSLRSAGDDALDNQVGMMRVALGTHIANPLQRLEYVRRESNAAKRGMADLAGLMPGNISAPGLPLAMQWNTASAASLAQAGWVNPSPVNVVVSNVPGPRNQLYSNGARMLTHYPVSIPAHGVGVNITVQSYMDGLFFGITACRQALPDAGQLRDDMLAEFGALQDLSAPPRLRREARPAAAGPARTTSDDDTDRKVA